MNESNFYAQNPSFSVGLPLSICLINYFDLYFIQTFTYMSRLTKMCIETFNCNSSLPLTKSIQTTLVIVKSLSE